MCMYELLLQLAICYLHSYGILFTAIPKGIATVSILSWWQSRFRRSELCRWLWSSLGFLRSSFRALGRQCSNSLLPRQDNDGFIDSATISPDNHYRVEAPKASRTPLSLVRVELCTFKMVNKVTKGYTFSFRVFLHFFTAYLMSPIAL